MPRLSAKRMAAAVVASRGPSIVCSVAPYTEIWRSFAEGAEAGANMWAEMPPWAA